ncbi:serine/threonine-protein kinase [Conyzicola nivalis]|uniref:serine/threonine-protein kinase n=1 Tax=Conyzicola nivalis TaxID=1477021 RepID=UPI00166D9363|nr:serine/threonine-protein kinase [Conyzicola nivalis]
MARRQSSSPPVLPGFTYVRPLGSGGFADVFLYEQDMPRRVVAIKVLVSDAINPEVLRTFNGEADIMARLSAHPSIVTIYQASISADGRPFLAMEYCPDTMSARFKKAPLSVGEVLDAGVRIAAALETAHRSSLLHRDIKPSNILITSLGTPVLADFGIAAALTADGEEADVFAMSVPWSAAEVLAEKTTGTVASEIWSLGATLYTLLAGRSPFEVADRAKNNRDQLTARVAKAAYTPIGRHDVPDQLEEILARSMSKDPAKRPASMYAFAEDLRRIQYGLGMPPTALEVAAAEWAAATPINLADTVARGPVITTVNKDSRRARRAGQTAVRRDVDDSAAPKPTTSATKAGLIGAGVAVGAIAVVGGIAFAVLQVI